MKQDKLEKYIVENRAQLDTALPPDEAWSGISSKLKKNDRSYLRYWQAAAVVFFVFTVGLLFNNYQKSIITGESELASEFDTTEEYYFQVIKAKESQLTTYLKQYPDLAYDFKNDLLDLENNYQKLKREFETTEKSEVLSALIKNLQLQQELLNNQLDVIQLIKKENENISI